MEIKTGPLSLLRLEAGDERWTCYPVALTQTCKQCPTMFRMGMGMGYSGEFEQVVSTQYISFSAIGDLHCFQRFCTHAYNIYKEGEVYCSIHPCSIHVLSNIACWHVCPDPGAGAGHRQIHLVNLRNVPPLTARLPQLVPNMPGLSSPKYVTNIRVKFCKYYQPGARSRASTGRVECATFCHNYRTQRGLRPDTRQIFSDHPDNQIFSHIFPYEWLMVGSPHSSITYPGQLWWKFKRFPSDKSRCAELRDQCDCD